MHRSSTPSSVRRLAVLLAVVLFLPCSAARQYNILWIGNSLTNAWWPCNGGVGWLAVADYANKTADQTGINLAGQAVILGATPLSRHWTLRSGFDLIDNPTVCDPNWPTSTISASKYDYLVLQTWSTTGADLAAESTAVCRYADLALSKGIVPVLFQCWVNHPEDYTAAHATWDSVYAHYKSRGMLIAPLMDAHHAINAQKPVSYLYLPGDAYLHPSLGGVFLTTCTFVYLFTKTKPTDFDLDFMPHCPDIDTVVPAQKDYIATQAEAALSRFYDLGNTKAHRNMTVGPTARTVCDQRAYDFAGRVLSASNRQRAGVRIMVAGSKAQLDAVFGAIGR